MCFLIVHWHDKSGENIFFLDQNLNNNKKAETPRKKAFRRRKVKKLKTEAVLYIPVSIIYDL